MSCATDPDDPHGLAAIVADVDLDALVDIIAQGEAALAALLAPPGTLPKPRHPPGAPTPGRG